jgi:transcriptional regulator with XRE-family HTH domain
MARALIGRTVRRLRTERDLSQQVLATRLGISASYLNLIEHDQRAVTASLLIKLGETLRIDLAALSGSAERQLEVGMREAFADPALGAETVPEAEVAALAASSPTAARAVLALYRAWRVAREDASGIALPSGRRIVLPNEEARDLFDAKSNHFAPLEQAAEAIATALGATPSGLSHAIAERLRQQHGVTVTVQPLDGALRRYDPATRVLVLSEALARESRGFQLAFQLALLEARDAVEQVLRDAAPSSAESAMLIRVGLLNYAAGALVMPYAPFRAAAQALRHDVTALAARFGVSFEQVCNRLATLQRPGARGVPYLLRAGRSGRQRIETVLRRGVSVCPVWRLLPALGGAHRLRRARNDPGAGGGTAGRRGVPVLRPHGRPPGRALEGSGAGARGGDGLRGGTRRRGGLRGRAGSGARKGGHRVVVPIVRSPGLPQPRLPAAGAPAGARSELDRHKSLSIRGEARVTKEHLRRLCHPGGVKAY